MEGLFKEADEIIESTDKGTMVRDCGLIMAAQKVEHYARAVGFDSVAELLQQTLDQENETDHILTELAQTYVNEQASVE